MKDVRVRITSQRKAEIKAIEKMKDAHIHELMKQHKEAFNEIKNYYNDITHNNLDLIKSLKEEVSDLKKSDVERSKSKDEIALKHKRMTEPLKRMRLEVAELKKQLEAYNEDKSKLGDAKEALMELEERHRVLEWENEVLTQRLEALEAEREQLKTSFNESIYEVQQKAGFKNLLLEKRLAAVSEEAETFEAQLGGVQQLTAQDTAGAAAGVTAAEGNEVLLEKQTMARELEQVGCSFQDQMVASLHTTHPRLQSPFPPIAGAHARATKAKRCSGLFPEQNARVRDPREQSRLRAFEDWIVAYIILY